MRRGTICCYLFNLDNFEHQVLKSKSKGLEVVFIQRCRIGSLICLPDLMWKFNWWILQWK